jgi:hypothetical protein
MAIHYAQEPANGTELVRAGLEKAASRPSALTGRAADLSGLELSAPHRVYDLRADQIAGGAGLASATETGFRYLVSGGGRHVAAAEVHLDASGAAKLLANINYGPYVEATAQAIAKAGVLSAAAIGVMALWLRPDAGGADIVYPMAPTPAGLEAERAYTEAGFLAAIRPLAERRAAKKDPASVP